MTARAARQGAIQKQLVDIDAVISGTVDDQGKLTYAEGPCPGSYEVLMKLLVWPC